MKDEATSELLSRSLDGDLTQKEQRELDELIQADRSLLHELETLRELTATVRSFAQTEAAPPELARLLEPLRRSPPPRRGARPVFRWMAAAATIVLAIAVTHEVAQRRSPQPPIASAPEGALEASSQPTPSGELFHLQPLPQSPHAEEVAGAADMILAQTPVAPALDEPPPITVIGPLEEPASAAQSAARQPPPAASAQPLPHGASPPALVHHDTSFQMQANPTKRSATSSRSCVLTVVITDGTTQTVRATTSLPVGHYLVLVTVSQHTITGLEPVAQQRQDWLAEGDIAHLIGRSLPETADGVYSAELVVSTALHLD